jgi:hypothetical protein
MVIINNNGFVKEPQKASGRKSYDVSFKSDFKMKIIELKNDFILSIHCDRSQFLDFYDYFLERSLSDYTGENSGKIQSASTQHVLEENFFIPWSCAENDNILTVRELDIMEKLSEGLPNKEIACSLGLCLNTVEKSDILTTLDRFRKTMHFRLPKTTLS